MTTRLSDRQAEVDRRYIQMEHHRATLTAAQDAAEQAAWACKNNFDTTTDKAREARQELKEFTEALRPWRRELLLAVFVVAGFGALLGAFVHSAMAEIAAWLCRCFPPTNTELSTKNAATWADGEESLRWPTVPLIAWCGQWTAKE